MSIRDKIKEYIRELVRRELEEASVTGNLDGGAGPPKTPYMFQSKPKSKKDKEKEKKIAQAGGYMKVDEARFAVKFKLKPGGVDQMATIIVDATSKGEAKMRVAKSLKAGQKGIVDVTRVQSSAAKQIDKRLESVNETPQMAKQGQVGLLVKLANKQLQNVFSLHKRGKNKEAKVVLNNKVYSTMEYISRAFKTLGESKINEGQYHNYRNDDSMTPRQKIGLSMREVRDKLNELDKLVKINVRLKNELNVDSKSYWKRTHAAMKKISERLVKLANKVGQLY